MIYYRKFKLVNQAGEKLDLSEVDKLFWADIEGLGLDIDLESITIGNFLKIINSIPAYQPISGLMRYGSDKRDSYRQFTKLQAFIGSSRTLYLEYELPTPILYLGKSNSVRAEVALLSTSKTEIKENNILEETLEFKRLSPWSSDVIKKTTISSITPGDVYEPDRTYDEDITYDDSSSTDTTIINMTTGHAYMEIFIEGLSQNPIIRLRNVNTNEIEVLWQYNGTINADEKLHHNSKPFNRFVLMNDISNVYQNVNKNPGFSSLVTIPPGVFKLEYETTNAESGLLTTYHTNNWLVV